MADPPRPAAVRGPRAQATDARDRHQGDRPARALRAGRQDRDVRRRRRGKDGDHPGDDPPAGAAARRRLRVRLSALTMAEYFRDVERKDVLLFVDNIFRFTQAGSEVSTLLGRMPSAVGYQPTLADEMGELQERITSTKGRSITSLQAIFVPADDITDPAPHTAFAHLDATTVLSRDIAALGIYPAVDPLDSTRRIQLFLSQPFFVAEQFTGIPGKYVPVGETIASFRALTEGEYDHLPEQAFLLVGGVEEAVQAAEKMKQAA